MIHCQLKFGKLTTSIPTSLANGCARAHASTSIIANFFPNDKMFGFLIQNEIKSVETVLNSSKYPLTAIVGGAKVSSKITIILKLIEKVDHLIIGGGMAYTFIKAQKGSIGKSLV